jgi:phosphoadenosine phosphosulfate reductase
MSERVTPFHCPYCGDEDLRPHADKHGGWECRSCLRAFSLKMLGIVPPAQEREPAPRPVHGSPPPSWSAAELRDIALRAGRELEEAPAAAVLEWAVATFGKRFAVTSSMGDVVLTHLASQVVPGIDVVFLDTGYHFAETIGTRDAVAATLPVNLLSITPVQSVAEQDAAYGPRLHQRDPDLCCALRKVAPLESALERYDAWATGLRRDETPDRADTPVVGWDDAKQKVKIAPLARWSHDDVERFVAENNVLVNPLLHDGYPSIGCAPCTRRVAPGEDPRSGRWSGTAKTECGLHA